MSGHLASLTFSLTALATLLAIACWFLYQRVCDQQDRIMEGVDLDHHLCAEKIRLVVQGAHDVTLLRHLADKYESVEEQSILKRLANEQYQPGGPSMPAIWLRHKADEIETRLVAKAVEAEPDA